MTTQREAFEAWADKYNHSLVKDEADGEYLFGDTHYAWMGWQAAQSQAFGVSVEPVAWMRPSVTENGIVYDSSFRDENGMVLPETREEQGFERLYTAEQLAAARVAALEEAAKVCDRQAIPNAGFLAEKVRALINTNLTTGEMK